MKKISIVLLVLFICCGIHDQTITEVYDGLIGFEHRFDNAGEFLDRLRMKVKDTQQQDGSAFEQKDGMDMSLAILDKEHQELQYAGAFNPLFLIRSS